MSFTYHTPEDPIVIVDEKYFKTIKENATLNLDEIEKRAFELYKQRLGEGIDLNLTINDSKSILYNSSIVFTKKDGLYFYSPTIEGDAMLNTKQRIIDDIVSEANKQLEDKRQSIIDSTKDMLTQKEQSQARRKSFWFCMSIILFITNLILIIFKYV